MPHLQPIVKVLDESIRATIPVLQYAVKWKRPYYGLADLGWIIEMAAYDVSVNVVFSAVRTSTAPGKALMKAIPLGPRLSGSAVLGSVRWPAPFA